MRAATPPLKISRDNFLTLKQLLAEQLSACQVGKEEAVAQLVAAGWEESLAIDFVGFALNGTAE